MRQHSNCGIVRGCGQAILKGHELRSLDEYGVVSHGRPPAHVGRRLPRYMDRVAPMWKTRAVRPRAVRPASQNKSASWPRQGRGWRPP